MADTPVYRCIICDARAEGRPPRRCPNCGAPAARWRLDVDRPPSPPSPPSPPANPTSQEAR